jgi:alanyl-tRNA synthetase
VSSDRCRLADQGPDRAVLDAGDVAIEVLDCVVGATDGTTLFLGSDIPVRKGTEGWAFVVAHLVDPDASLTEGDTVTVEVDETHRAALSAGHTACHLASLALNAALAGAWSKETGTDGLGSPDFDATAIETSTILENGSRDVYRVGKSVRKKGFDPAALGDTASLASSVNATPGILDRDRRRGAHRPRR